MNLAGEDVQVMGEIRPLPEEHLASFVNILSRTYPSLKLTNAEAKENYRNVWKERASDPRIQLNGYYREEQLLGGQIYFDLQMNVLQTKMLVGGVGMVAVDLLGKKERIAKELITGFLRHYRDRGAALTTLYPFRTDFYKKMGFGFGTKMNHYSLKPAQLPIGPSKAHLQYITEKHHDAVLACYDRYVSQTHGMADKMHYEIKTLFTNQKLINLAYVEGEQVRGFLAFYFDKPEPDSNFGHNDIVVRELIYEKPEVLREFLTFLHLQADQIHQVHFDTQDESFYHLFDNANNGSNEMISPVYHASNTSGVGLMYRVIDTKRMFELLAKRNFGDQTCKLKLTVEDSFLPENHGSTILHFQEGYVQVAEQGDYEVEASLTVQDFSALLMGTVDFAALHRYGLVQLSDAAYANMLQNIFRVESKPMCTTAF